MRIYVVTVALVLALTLVVAGAALANGGAEAARWALSGGASDSASGGVSLRATLGQPVVGVVTSSGGVVALGQGFWHGFWHGGSYGIYLPLILR